MAEEQMYHAYMPKEHELRGEMHPTIEGEFEEIKPLAIEGPP